MTPILSRLRSALIIVVVLLSGIAAATAQNVDIRFPRGPGTTVRDTLAGDQIINYGVEVPAGTTMSIRLNSDNAASHFKVTPVGASDALYNGSADSNDNSFEIRSAGNYVISIYLARGGARTNDTANYDLTFRFENSSNADFGQRARLRPVAPLELSWMPDFCKGEANAEFSARGPTVTTNAAVQSENRYVVQGSYDATSGAMPFECSFGLDGVYQAITRKSE